MLTKLVRIGRDSEMKYLPNGTAVMSFPAVYDIGFGDKKRGQWIECVMFGDRCTKVTEYMTKGKQIVIYAEDVGIEEWDKTDGTGKGFKLKCKLVSFDFVSEAKQPAQQQGHAPQQQAAQRQAPQQAPQQAQPPQGQPMGVSQQGMDQFDDNLPF